MFEAENFYFISCHEAFPASSMDAIFSNFFWADTIDSSIQKLKENCILFTFFHINGKLT